LLIILLFFVTLISNSFANEIVAIKTYDREDYIRIMFETTEKPKYFIEQKQNKINIKIPNMSINSPLHKSINKLDIIEDILLSRENDDLKFIVILDDNISMKRYLYTEPSDLTKYYRIIVDIYKKEQTTGSIENILNSLLDDEIIIKKEKNINDVIYENVKAADIDELLVLNNITEEEITKNIENQNNEKVNIDDFLKKISVKIEDETPLPKKKVKIGNIFSKKNIFVVVIDAGHGGKDPGAIGRKIKEKDVNLTFAKALKYELDKNKNLKVYLTRSTDNFIELSERVNKSRNLKADLFISLHADSNPNKKARGLSIYTLPKGASDTRTTQFSDIKTLNSRNVKNEIFSTILDISRYKTLSDSTNFANSVIKNFRREGIRMQGNPHKYGNFAVLLAPEYPSILIELGFISNLDDEKMLQTSEYKKKIITNIAKAVESYASLHN
jgi:N-acetylmuramoyl-L-alanine amidase